MRALAAVGAHRKISLTLMVGCLAWAIGCSNDRRPTPAAAPPSAAPPVVAQEPSKPDAEAPVAEVPAYRAVLGHGADLYIPPWFAAKRGGYDLIVHFHGLSRLQEANIERAKLNVAIVSVNLGAGTDPYSNAFKTPEAFDRLLADTQAEIVKSGRAEGHAQLRRLALSAWSAGFSSVARVMTDAVAQRVDAVLLADGFFTFFTEPKKRTVNAQGLEKFARFAEAARRDEKLFALTHTTIPTGPYPSVQECVTKLLAMIDTPKTPAVALGPRDMHQFYVVDRGSLHIRGFEGTQASDHVKQLNAMGETVYPLLKARWDKQDDAASPEPAAKRVVDPPQPRAAP